MPIGFDTAMSPPMSRMPTSTATLATPARAGSTATSAPASRSMSATTPCPTRDAAVAWVVQTPLRQVAPPTRNIAAATRLMSCA